MSRAYIAQRTIQVLLADPDVSGLEVCDKDHRKTVGVNSECHWCAIGVQNYFWAPSRPRIQNNNPVIVQVPVKANRLHFRRFGDVWSRVYAIVDLWNHGVIIIKILTQDHDHNCLMEDVWNSASTRMANGRPYQPWSELPLWWTLVPCKLDQHCDMEKLSVSSIFNSGLLFWWWFDSGSIVVS